MTYVALAFNIGHVLTKTNQRVKYKGSVTNSSQDNERKPFFTEVTLVTLIFDLVNPKSIGFLSLLIFEGEGGVKIQHNVLHGIFKPPSGRSYSICAQKFNP